MKRIYTFLLLSLFVWSAAMAEVFSGTFGANGDNLTWTLDTETGALVISGEGAMANYEWNTSPWYSYKSNIVSVEINDGVTTIGNQAFYYCSGLTCLTIPNSVTTIGERAFFDCSGLTSLTIPNSVTTIGGSAFRGCPRLTSISVADDNPYYDSRNDCNAIIETASNTLVAGCKNTVIPNSVTEIGYGAFDCCVGLMNLTIPNSVTTIGKSAFSSCSGLTSLTIPNSVTEIESYAFSGCSGLTNIAIPNSVTSIETSTFAYCTALDSIYIPSSVSEIGIWVFAHCDALEKIIVDPNNSKYDSRENCNGIVESETNALIIGCKTTTIPSDVTSIANCAFDDCTLLTSLTIPSSVTNIGAKAFANCSGLTSLSMLSATPPSTGSDVFSYCNALTTIYVPVGAAANYDLAPWNNYNIIGETLGVVSSNPATGEEVEGLSVITLTFNKEIKSINESLIKLTATSSSTQVPVSVQINATNTKALTITLSQAVYNGDTYVLTLAAGAVTAMDDKSNEEALEMSYVVTAKPLADVDLSKLYRIKDVGTGLYLNAANYDVHEVGTHGGVNAVGKANSDDQVFTLSKDGNNFKLQTASGKYIYCQGWNVDALDEGTALSFVPAEEGAFYIMRGSQYFKIEEVESVYYPFCDAPESKRAKFVLEEVVRVALTDGEDYTQAAEMEAERITYTRNFKNTYYQPWYVPFDVEYDEIIDRFVVAELNDIHQFDDNNDGEFERWAIEVLRLKSGDVISANHPYMIKARTTGEQSIVVENTTLYPAVLNKIDCSSTKMLYTFDPTYTTLSGSVLRAEGCYVVGSGKLVMPTDGSVVKANRWYLRPEPRNGGSLLSAPKQIQIFERDENGLTDIETAIEESEQTTWPADVYDLNGRLVKQGALNLDGLRKGVYIVNGKKIVK